jgi:MPBQ/MSBQ methyltransferase
MKKFEEVIKAHLIDQYHGILLPSSIDNHIRNHVQNLQSDYLIQKISPIIKDGAKILDVGSGYGSFVFSAIKNGYDAYGIELAEFEYKISKKKALEYNMDPKRFLMGSAIDLPYLDESFDVVCFWNVLEHVENYKLVIKEAKRVLRPGGLIFIIAPNYCAFRKEAHYHLPWIPMLPKPLARLYLRAAGRKTSFLDDCIFYITIFGLKRYLKSQNLYVSIDINEKIKRGDFFQSQKVNVLIAFCRKYKLGGLLKKAIFLLKTHPFSHSIDLIAKK